jgi:hypothetical protein
MRAWAIWASNTVGVKCCASAGIIASTTGNTSNVVATLAASSIQNTFQLMLFLMTMPWLLLKVSERVLVIPFYSTFFSSGEHVPRMCCEGWGNFSAPGASSLARRAARALPGLSPRALLGGPGTQPLVAAYEY